MFISDEHVSSLICKSDEITFILVIWGPAQQISLCLATENKEEEHFFAQNAIFSTTHNVGNDYHGM